MATSRIDTLRQMADLQPDSVFVRYGLAMEYVKAGEMANAISEFEAVLGVDPAYSAAYYHGGQTFEKMGKLDEARDLYRRGLANSRDPHARGELEAALSILGD
ncbi:MAG: tetratricopeptide repeat protein [Bryobacteraceae bacterium]